MDGQLLHFDNIGLYDALFIMQDKETKTLWNHITGEALYGPHVGKSLGPPGNVFQMSVRQALTADAKTRVAISDRIYFVNERPLGTATGTRQWGGPARGGGARAGGAPPQAGGRRAGGGPRTGADAQLSAMFIETLGKEDTRRPRMDMGLGVWTGGLQRFYPMERIRAKGEAFIDPIGGRKVLVYVDPETYTPAAIFVDATSARVQGKEVVLDNGQIVRAGTVFSQRGQKRSTDAPQQVFTRWYGFALTFPTTEVFGQ